MRLLNDGESKSFGCDNGTLGTGVPRIREFTQPPPRYHVLGDAGRLQQVLWNLFSNAIKFTPPGGSIELRTSVVAGTELRMCLTDSGRGIDWGSLESIFEPFEQGDLSVPTQFGGLGLGLD
jgi:signal transduction histidine kinase